MKYTPAERLAIGKRIYENELNRYQAAILTFNANLALQSTYVYHTNQKKPGNVVQLSLNVVPAPS